MTKKSFVLMAAAAMTTAAVAIGGTLAYLMDNDELMNTFSMGGEGGNGDFSIVLSETEIDQNGVLVDGVPTWTLDTAAERNTTGIDYAGVQPGATLPKEPTVENTGSFPMWVRMQATLPDASVWANALDINPATNANDLATAVLTGTPADFTVSAAYDAEADTLTVSFLHNEVLLVGETTAPAFTTVKVPSSFVAEDLTAIGTINLPVVAHAIQTDPQETYTTVEEAMVAYERETQQVIA